MESPFLHASGLLRYIGLFLSGVCHQLPEHSLQVAGVQLPLCARCSGTYLGALTALLYFVWRRRSRSSWLPPLRVMAVLVLSFAFWAVDGINSYVHYITGSGILYAPSNLLRLSSGLANGVTLTALLFPLLNFTLWAEPEKKHVIGSMSELAIIAVPMVVLGLLLHVDMRALAAAFVVLDLAGVLVMLGMVNAIIALLLLQRESRVHSWAQILPVGALGLLMGAAEVGSIALVRFWWFS